MKSLTLLAFSFSVAMSAQQASVSHNSNLRSAPSQAGKIVGHLTASASVTVISKFARSGYVRVETAGDDTGWVYQKNVTVTQSGESTSAAQPNSVPNEVPATAVGNQEIYPRSQLTPGKGDPSVTQGNIAKNICNKSWSTDSVRPDTSVTDKIKVDTMKSYGFADAANHYELDHLVSLQNGGCPDCVENLWPEAYGDQKHPMTEVQRAQWNKQHPGSADVLPGALEKDVVENHIHDEICRDTPNAKMSSNAKKYPATVSVTLARGQQILATDWFACYKKIMDGNKPCE